MTVGTTFLVIKTLMEKALVSAWSDKRTITFYFTSFTLTDPERKMTLILRDPGREINRL